MKQLKLLILLPFINVFLQVGIASSFPEILKMFGNNVFYTSTFIAITPLMAIIFGSLWSIVISKVGEKKTFQIVLIGSSLSVFLIALTIGNPILGIILRGIEGIFDSALFGVAFAGVGTAKVEQKVKTKYFGLIDFMASLGSVLGPIIIGSIFIFSPMFGLIGVAVLELTYGLIGSQGIENTKIEAPHHEHVKIEEKFNAIVLLAAFFGIATLITIVYFQIKLPMVLQGKINSDIITKLFSSAFSLLVMFGNIAKHKFHGIHFWMPLGTGLSLFLAWIFVSNLYVSLIFILIAAFLLGLSLSMGNEYAANLSQGFEQKGMTVYSSLRITGNFAGPYIVSLDLTSALMLLSAVTFVSTGLLRYSKE